MLSVNHELYHKNAASLPLGVIRHFPISSKTRLVIVDETTTQEMSY